MAIILRLNDDIIFDICKYLDIFGFLSLTWSCSRFYNLAVNNRTLWKSLVTRYDGVRDFMQPWDVDTWNTADLRRSVFRTLYLHCNLQREEPYTQKAKLAKTSGRRLRHFFQRMDRMYMADRFLIVWKANGNVLALDLMQPNYPIYEINTDYSSCLLLIEGGIYAANRGSGIYVLFRKTLAEDSPTGFIVIQKLGFERQDVQNTKSLVTTVAEFPLICHYMEIRGFAIDVDKGRVAMVFTSREPDLNATLKLIVIFDWVSNTGVVLDTEIPCEASTELWLVASKVFFTEDGQDLVIWSELPTGFTSWASKKFKMSILENFKGPITVDPFPSFIKSTECLSHSEQLSFPLEQQLETPAPWFETRSSEAHYSGPRYDDLQQGLSCFTSYQHNISRHKFGYAAIHFYANSKNSGDRHSNLSFFDVSRAVAHYSGGPLLAVDSHHLCWIDADHPRAPCERKLLLIRFVDAQIDGPRYRPRVIDAPATLLDNAVDLWLRMDVASIVIRTRGNGLHSIQLA